MYTCSKCKTLLPAESFSYYQSRTRGLRRRSRCKECEIQRHRDYASANRLHKREVSAASRARKLALGGDVALRIVMNQRLGGYKRTSRQENIPFALTADYLIKLFHHQGGRCYYTNEELLYNHQLGFQQQNSLSLDRLNPDEGYVEGNVVFCTNFANTAKGAKTLDEFLDFCRLVLATRNVRSV